MAQLILNNLKTFKWYGDIDFKPFEVKVFAGSVEEARKEVITILEHIDVLKREHDELRNKLKEKCKFDETTRCMKYYCDDEEVVRARLKEIALSIDADFFNGSFALSEFDYHSDAMVSVKEGEVRLIDFIRTTEPLCKAPIRAVSFTSCLDG